MKRQENVIAHFFILVIFLVGIANVFRYLSDPHFLYIGAYDHAIIAHAAWNFIHHYNVGSSIGAVHLSPLQWFIARIAHVFYPDVNKILIFMSSLFVLLGIVPVYFIARKIFPDIFLAQILFPVTYLMFPSFQTNRFIPHHELMIPFLFLSAFYFIMEKRYTIFIFFLVLLLGVKQNMSIVIVPVFGIYYYLIHWKKSGGGGIKNFFCWILFPIILGLSYWYLIALPLSDVLDLGQGVLAHMGHVGDSLPNLIFSMIKNPSMISNLILRYNKSAYLVDMFKQTIFIPILSPSMLIITFPSLLQKFAFQFPVYVDDHYQNMINGPIIIAMIYGFKRIIIWVSGLGVPKKLGVDNHLIFSLVTLVMFVVFALSNQHILRGGSILFYNPDIYKPLDRYKGVLTLGNTIPKNASVIADYFLFVYVYDRVELGAILEYNEDLIRKIDSFEYVLMPLEDEVYYNSRGNEFTRLELVDRLKNSGFQVIRKESNVILLRKAV